MAHLATMKPEFLEGILGLPPKEAHQVQQKVALLLEDPRPDGKAKKQLKGFRDKVCRLRAGDYRVFYTFDPTYVSLLAIRRRDETTYDKEVPGISLGGLDGDLTPAHAPWEKLLKPVEPARTPLPEPITSELLDRLRIPSSHHPRLRALTDRESLYEVSGVPDELLLRLDTHLFERPIAEVAHQRDLVLAEPADLLRYKEGDLLGFLLRLDSEQERLVSWSLAAKGPALLKGGPGTGKSIVALYRVRALLDALEAGGKADSRLLYLTYTNALVAYSRQLLGSLLGPRIERVEVRTADSLVRQLVDGTREGQRNLVDQTQLRASYDRATRSLNLAGNVLEAEAQKLALERLGANYVLDEIQVVLEARGISSLEEYLAAPRPGRRLALNRIQRSAVHAAWLALESELARQGKITWGGLRTRALKVLEERPDLPRYDGLVVDEAQDLAPTVLRILARVVESPARLFLAADANQSIYGSGFSWADACETLRFRGRTAVLRTNYRSTREIGEAARHWLAGAGLEPEEAEPRYHHQGAVPAVRGVDGPAAECDLLATFVRAACRELRFGPSSAAVLVPSEDCGSRIAAGLTERGLPARFMASRELDLQAEGVKVLTLKGAKGLEFPVVALAGFVGGRYPNLPRGMAEEARAEAEAVERRTLYVAMTRAMRALLIVIPADAPPSLLTGFDPQLWNLGMREAAP